VRRTLVTASGLALVASVAVLDHLTAGKLSLSILYLVPILLVAHTAGRGPGVVLAAASALAWLAVDQTTGPVRFSAAILVWNLGLRLGLFLATALLLTTLNGALERERDLARRDVLTGLHNARSFWERADLELARAGRYVHPFTVAYIDLDNFKLVNDRGGHSAGDRLLRLVARTTQSRLRQTDVVARLGGDEFALLLPETSYEAAEVVLGTLRDLLREALRQQEFPVTFSIGAVTFQRPPQSVEELIRTADHLMYSVKRAGKDGLRHERIEPARPVTLPREPGPAAHGPVDVPNGLESGFRKDPAHEVPRAVHGPGRADASNSNGSDHAGEVWPV